MLLLGRAQYQKLTKEFSMMEAVRFEDLEALPSPRVFNSHLPMNLLPAQFTTKRIKVRRSF